MATASYAVAPVLVLALLLGGCSDGPPAEQPQGKGGSGPATALRLVSGARPVR